MPAGGDGHSDPVPRFPYREIRSARFPLGLPDRCDDTVLEAFADAWLLIEHTEEGASEVGLAEDYAAARTWLDEQPSPPDQ